MLNSHASSAFICAISAWEMVFILVALKLSKSMWLNGWGLLCANELLTYITGSNDENTVKLNISL
jgi:hypothetical protein